MGVHASMGSISSGNRSPTADQKQEQGEKVALDQLDHFIGLTGCNQATTYGREKTVKLLVGP
jgi:hypothetical protein